MSFFEELASYLEDQDATFVFDTEAGRNTFVGVLPPEPDTCISFVGLPGTNIMAQRDVKGLHFPRYQIITRSKDFEEAAELFEKARAVLHGVIAKNIGEYRLMRSHAEQEGGPIGEDDQGRFEYSCNFIAEYYKIPETP